MKYMFDFDGDGDIDEFDEEMMEYELQMMEDEAIAEEIERGQYQVSGQDDDRGKSCIFTVLVAASIIVLIYIFLSMWGI